MKEKKLPCEQTTQALLTIEGYLQVGQLGLAVREGGRLLEKVLKEMYQIIFFHVPFQQRTKIQEIENSIGNGKKGMSQFSLGEMVRLYIEAKFQKKWTSYAKTDFLLFSGVDLGTIVLNRNRCVHPLETNKKPVITQCQAELCISILKTFLVATGYVKDYVNKVEYTSQTNIQSLWQLKEPQSLVIVTANSSQTPTGEYLRPATGIGQVRAMAYAISSLSKAYNNIGMKNIHLSTDQIQDRIEHDLIILGGPKNNQIARDFLDLLVDVQPANQIGSKLIWKKHNDDSFSDEEHSEFYGEVHNESVRTDFGLIIRAQNVFSHDNRTAILISGSHTYGTMAAAKYFVEKIQIEYPDEVEAGMNFSFLIKCQIRNEYPLGLIVGKNFFWPRGI